MIFTKGFINLEQITLTKNDNRPLLTGKNHRQGIIHKKSLKGSYHLKHANYLQKAEVNNKPITTDNCKKMLLTEENQEQDIHYKRHEN